ncbi:MAG: leucine-rich repeat protein [Bacteroidales bacterium]|nr:leucine-rich repeat protein [Bacteroidales bacterium]
MKKFLLSIFAIAGLCLAIPCQAQTYDFSAVAPSGQMLYYKIINGGVQVIRPAGYSSSGYLYIVQGNLVIPDSVLYYNSWYRVISLDSYAFSECISLNSVTIPNTFTSIDGYGAFSSCPSLTSVNFPDSLISISNGAFMGCESLLNITIPNTVTSIGDQAFAFCYSLTNINIPSSVTYIGEEAFWGCSSNLDSITVSSDNPVFDSRNDCNAIIHTASNNLILGCKNTVIPNTVTSIENKAFSYCSSLIDIAIPNSVTHIGNCAFENCTSLTNINFPNSVTAIGNYAFNECPSLTSVTIPSSVTYIGFNIFNTSIDTLNVSWIFPLGGINPYYFGIINIPCGTTDFYQYVWGNGNYHEPNADVQLIVAPSSIEMGNVLIVSQNGSNVKCTDSTAIVKAIANYGYHFAQWDNGHTVNPDTLHLQGDSSVIAIFDKNLYVVNGIAEFSEIGIVTGSDTVEYLDTVILTATANYGYHFTRWNDWNYDNPRQVVATGDLSFTAQFDYNQYNITLDVDTIIHGTVDGAGDYNYLSQRTIAANAEYGYHFTQWHDGNTDNPRTITLTQDTSFTAIFAKNLYSVAGVSEEYSSPRGVILGSDTVEYLDNVILTATANYGYHFSQWNDGNIDNPREIVATEDLLFTALFDYNQYSITLNVDTIIHGVVDGAGDYNYLSQRMITADAEYGYHFTQWNDGNTDNPRTITLTQDTAFTAYFAKNLYTLTVSSNDNSIGSVTGSGTYEYLDEVPVIATTIVPHYHFVAWSDGETDTMRTIIITENLSLAAIFAIDTHHVSLMVNNENYGYVVGNGDYPYGSTVMISATPYNDYYFVYWNNGDTINPNSFTVTEDTLLTAFFAPEIIPAICMVTVQDGHNVLMWEKDQTVSGYNIYRESVVAGEYELLAALPYDSLSIWTDTASQPRTRSYRYRLSTTDIYGHEAGMSDIHKTMHLTINQGMGNQWNLVWTEYEGADYTTYVIYRGTNASNIQMINVMPSGGNTTYTDESAPAGDVYYQVGIMLTTPCNPTKSENVVLSNVATNNTTGIPNVVMGDLQVFAHNGQIVVNSEIEMKDVQIFDISGKLLKSVFVNGNNSVINTTDFAAGVYIVRVNTTNGPVTCKVVKR